MDKYTRRLLLENVPTSVPTRVVPEYRLNRRDIYKEVSTEVTTEKGPLSNLVYRSLKKLTRRRK